MLLRFDTLLASLLLTTLFALGVVRGAEPMDAETIDAVPDGRALDDHRLEPLTDLNGYFPFTPPETQREWSKRSALLKQRMRIALGLWPTPARSELRAVVHGRRDQGDYTIEKVYFESWPGFYVTGSLYRPKGELPKDGRPGVLSPHGHWSNGRFYDAGESKAKQDIASGAERMMSAARSPLQARCAQLARMGCVVFHYDMIGYADSKQISFEIAHRFARQRPELKSPDRYGLFSPQAESMLQSVMQLQTLDSIRALDFLRSLPDVDADRIAVTGASGGGTQTFILSALDPRVAVSVPAVMVSTAMQGGCTCENASLLRVEHGNVDFAALFAPKPLALTAADDWTKEMSDKGFPQLKSLYELLNRPENVALLSRTEFGHNYNSVSRRFMYQWLNRHLDLGLDEPLEERDFERLTAEELTVWDERHPKPEGGVGFEVELLRQMAADAEAQIRAVHPRDAESARSYRRLVGEGLHAVIGRGLPEPSELDYEQTYKREHDSYLTIAGVLTNKSQRESTPIAFLFPKDWKDRVVVWLSKDGKQGLLREDGTPRPGVRRLLDKGVSVVGVDLFGQGESSLGEPLTQTRRVANTRESAAYTFGYNHSLLARRAHDVLATITFVRNHEYRPRIVDLVSVDAETAPIAAAARAQARDAVDHAAIHTHGFRFIDVSDLRDPQFLPGGAKYDDLEGMLAVAAPAPLLLAGEARAKLKVVRDAYAATGGRLTIADQDDFAEQAARWLLTPDRD